MVDFDDKKKIKKTFLCSPEAYFMGIQIESHRRRDSNEYPLHRLHFHGKTFISKLS